VRCDSLCVAHCSWSGCCVCRHTCRSGGVAAGSLLVFWGVVWGRHLLWLWMQAAWVCGGELLWHSAGASILCVVCLGWLCVGLVC
jgi:hypothetical protein